MIEKGLVLLKKHREPIAYLFVGGTTTVLNIAVYWLLTPAIGDIPANTVAFFVAVMYAYFTNCLFVFNKKLTWANFFQFWGMRIGTLLVDDGGMWLMISAGVNGLAAKVAVSVLIVIINYIFSKFFIFKERRKGVSE